MRTHVFACVLVAGAGQLGPGGPNSAGGRAGERCGPLVAQRRARREAPAAPVVREHRRLRSRMLCDVMSLLLLIAFEFERRPRRRLY